MKPDSSSQIATVVNTQYFDALTALLDHAKRSIAVVHFELNQDADGDVIVQRLIAAAARGVTVRVLLEDSVTDNVARVAALQQGGVMARLDTAARYTHAKLVVADREQALFGSTNFSAQSMRRNNEANLLISEGAIASWFDDYAEKIRIDPDKTPEHVPLTGSLGTALQDGDYFDRASALVDGASRRVLLVVYGMNADAKYPESDVNELVRKLAAAQKRGVDVRVILEIAEPDLGVNGVNRAAAQALKIAGIAVRFDSPDEITHAKVLLADDAVIVGSNNWGYGGFRSYHEVGMQTREPKIVAELGDYLDSLWRRGTAIP